MQTVSSWRTKEGVDLLEEKRQVTVATLENGEWMLVLELELTPVKQPVHIGDTAFGMLGVRMAKSIGVKDGGGAIQISEGGVDELGCFRKKARWADYSGPVTNQS